MSEFVNVVIPPLVQPLTYDIPDGMKVEVEIGHRVSVPLGSRKTHGFVISKSQNGIEKSSDSFEVKPIDARGGSELCFDPQQLQFFQWVADYYGDALSNVIDVAVPPSVPQKFERTIVSCAASSEPLRGKLQQRIVDFLHENGDRAPYAEVTRRFKGAQAAIRSLLNRGLILIESLEVIDQHLTNISIPTWAKESVNLNADQERALSEISAKAVQKEFHTFLLHGATGSGKTEVYIEAIQLALKAGLGALVIVPEIALTPQLIDRFRARLGNQIAVLHSGLHRRIRWDSWRALITGRNVVAIGARSAIFAPVKNLGLIIVDEEHDTSFKQSDGLRYHARDLAIVRGKLEKCPVVLGSATPSLESFFSSKTNRHTYISLPERHIGSSSVSLDVVDMNLEKPWEMPSRNISRKLYRALEEVIQNGEQAFILYNRRGFASYLQCEICENVLRCPNCSVTFTYHQHSHSLLCHYCNLSIVPPQFCAECQNSDDRKDKPGKLVQRGAGTEKVFDEIKVLFPDVAMERLDRDAVGDIESYREILTRVRKGETQILVGTQMIAKGHDLPGVTVVGIVDCDVGLHMPDFRAGERVFQLLTQAAGRAGRGSTPGKVILQTRVPNHPSIVFTLKQDYESFVRCELATRKLLSYPPYTRLLRVTASAQDQHLASTTLEIIGEIAARFRDAHKLEATILGPAPAPLERLKTEWRWHLLIKSKSPSELNRIMHAMKSYSHKSKKVRVIYDLDPQEML